MPKTAATLAQPTVAAAAPEGSPGFDIEIALCLSSFALFVGLVGLFFFLFFFPLEYGTDQGV